MTRDDLNALAREVAEAAAQALRAGGDTVPGRSVTVIVPGSDWRAEAYVLGEESDALTAAAVVALRDRVVAQREERARTLAADDAALRVIDETARVYDAATVREAAREGGADEYVAEWLVRTITGRSGNGGPWTRVEVYDATATACDAILRRRAGGAP